MDRVEAAFRKFDSDGDGYIDWEEFKQVANKSVIDMICLYLSSSHLKVCTPRWPRI